MSEFSTLLKSALSMNDVSNRSLSQTLNIDRSRFQKILSGERHMDYDTFESICSRLTVPEKLNEDLRVAYAVEHFGKDNYDVIQHIIDRLCKMAKAENKFCPPPRDLGISGFSPTESLIPLNRKQHMLMDELMAIINLELEEKVPLVYTNFSFRQKAMKSYFLNIIQNRKCYIDFRHIHLTPMDVNSLIQINNFLDAFEFAGSGYNTWHYTMNSNLPMALLSPLPYFVLTSRVVLFFSEDMNFYISNMNADTVNSMHNYFHDIYNVCSSFAKHIDAPADFVKFEGLLIPNEQAADRTENCLFDTSNNICAAAFLTNDTLNELLPDTLPYKAYFTSGISRFYEAMREKYLVFTFEHNSLLDFINNEPPISDYHHVTFDGLALKPKHKLKILQSYYDFVTSGRGEAHLLNTSKIRLPKYFHINALPNGMTLGFNFKTYHPDTRELNVSIAATMNPVIHKHFANFSSFLVHSPFTYSAEHTEMVLKNALEYCATIHSEVSSI